MDANTGAVTWFKTQIAGDDTASATKPLSPSMQHINNVCAEYEVALGAIAGLSTADKPAI
jgi:hypothetical protein